MKCFHLFVYGIAVLMGFFLFKIPLDANPSVAQVTIHFFWGEGCQHCAEAKPFLLELVERNPQMELKMYEVWHDPVNLERLKAMGNKYGFTPKGVPVTFIGKHYFVGFNDLLAWKIEQTALACLKENCGAPATDQGVPSTQGKVTSSFVDSVHDVIHLPLIGRVNLGDQPLFVSTLLISFVDGFNPCSIWVLTMLLAITLHGGSRKKVFIIGSVYILVTGLIYALFIVGLFTVFSVVSYMVWVQSAVALVALCFALVNIKDYFWYKEGVSFTIADENKPAIYKGIQKIMSAGESTWGMISGTIVLAAGVSLIEFSCTAGFPVLWSNLLITQNASAATFISLLLVYMLIYQIDELVLFAAAVICFKATRIQEKHGRILKLVSGMLMLTLAMTMLLKPELINKLSSSLLVFGVAAGISVAILILHRFLLPKMGIHIGTEKLK